MATINDQGTTDEGETTLGDIIVGIVGIVGAAGFLIEAFYTIARMCS